MTNKKYKFWELTKKESQLINSLKSAHGRKKNNSFVVESVKNVIELLNSNLTVSALYLSDNLTGQKIKDFHRLCQQKNIHCHLLTTVDYQKISTLKNPEGVLAVCKYEDQPESGLENMEYPAVYLSEINDPGNLGTIIRTAAWFGIKTLLISENSVDAYNPKVLRGSMGGFLRLRIFQNINEASFIQFATEKEIALYAADLKGKNPVTLVPASQYILCFGSESHGVPQKILDHSESILSIPKFGSGESLNLAMSVGIILNSLINRGGK
jgi:TrmH family RNA methyltransferase